MKAKLPLYFTAASFLVILASFDVGTVFVYLLIAGQVPGTSIRIPATIMLGFYLLSLLCVAAYIIRARIAASHAIHRYMKLQSLPKRRFTQAA